MERFEISKRYTQIMKIVSIQLLPQSVKRFRLLSGFSEGTGELKEELVRLAVRHGIKIGTVSGSHVLNRYGGVGCLLRYLWPEHYT